MTDIRPFMLAICDKQLSSNPLPWFMLHKVGITLDLLKKASAKDTWPGRKPCFENYPDTNSTLWNLMEDDPDMIDELCTIVKQRYDQDKAK